MKWARNVCIVCAIIMFGILPTFLVINSRSFREYRAEEPIFDSVRTGDTNDLLRILTAGTDPNVLNPFHNTPLHVAAQAGDAGSIRLLIEWGAKIDAAGGKDGSSPLGVSASLGHIAACAELITLGASVNYRDNFGLTPLMYAAANGHLDVVRLLVAKGASTNVRSDSRANDRTARDYALQRGHMNIVRHLDAAVATKRQ